MHTLIRWPGPGLALILALMLSLGGCGDTPESPVCDVKRVADGDSVDLVCKGKKVKVRLYCIDAPELAQRPWGQQSKHYLDSIIHHRVILKAVEKDRYGRTVGELLSRNNDGQNFNLTMIMAGQAAVYRRYCKEKAYLQSEQQARDYRIGIWSRPGLHQRPWRYRHRHPRRQ
jgi:endonuclease YncB( thermonuclease family)